MMITLGLRKSELLRLRYGDITGSYITVNRVIVCGEDFRPTVKDAPKTAAGARTISVPPEVLNLILSKPHRSDDEYIITMSTQKLSRHLIAAEK